MIFFLNGRCGFLLIDLKVSSQFTRCMHFPSLTWILFTFIHKELVDRPESPQPPLASVSTASGIGSGLVPTDTSRDFLSGLAAESSSEPTTSPANSSPRRLNEELEEEEYFLNNRPPWVTFQFWRNFKTFSVGR